MVGRVVENVTKKQKMKQTPLIILFLNCYICLMAQTNPKQDIKDSMAKPGKISAPKRTKAWQSNLSLGIGGSLYNIKIGGEPLGTILLSSNYDSINYENTVVLMAAYDLKILKFLSVGAAYSYQDLSYDYSVFRTDTITYRGNFTDEVKRTNIGVRILYYFQDTDDLDIYTGLRAGYTEWKMRRTFEEDFTGYRKNKYKMQAVFGVRAFLHKNIGFMGEVGIGDPYLWTLGLCARL